MTKKIEYYLSDKRCNRMKEAIELLTVDNDRLKTVVHMHNGKPAVSQHNNLTFLVVDYTDKEKDETTLKLYIVKTSTQLKYSDMLEYDIYDESTCPSAYAKCPSKLLKMLPKTDDEKANEYREMCRDELAILAMEKFSSNSLTTLNVDTEIKLNNASGHIVEKVIDSNYKKPYWKNKTTGRRMKKVDIQEIGFTVLDK